MLTILPLAEARGYKCAAPTELLFLKAISLQVDPVDHCKADKIQFATIAKFVFSAHAQSYLMQILSTTSWNRLKVTSGTPAPEGAVQKKYTFLI